MTHIDYDKLAEQVRALTASMDGVSEAGRAFLHGAETALRATTAVIE